MNRPAIAFAPDGKKLLACLNPNDTGEQCWLIPWPPGPARRVFRNPALGSGSAPFGWMQDSRHIVAAVKYGSPIPRLVMADVETGAIWPVLAENRSTTAVTVSPDGSRLAFQSSASRADVIELPMDGGPVRTLLGSTRTEMMPHCSPVSRQIVYVTDRRGQPEVWIDSLAEGWSRPLLSSGDPGMPGSWQFMTPAFSPDGRMPASCHPVTMWAHTRRRSRPPWHARARRWLQT